jgi:RNA polymerase sigma-70 factor, ECF subfamily
VEIVGNVLEPWGRRRNLAVNAYFCEVWSFFWELPDEPMGRINEAHGRPPNGKTGHKAGAPGNAARRAHSDTYDMGQMNRPIEPTDEGLLAQIIAGNEEAFVQLYRRKQASIYRFALHMSGNPAIAEDVTQEVFMAIIRDAGRFDPARGSVGGFLFGIARNHLRKRWEQEQRFIGFDGDPDDLAPAACSNGNGAAGDRYGEHAMQRLKRAIATLPENYREALVLCDLQEMSYEEAAATLGCPVGTVRSRLHRSRALLTEKLRDERTYTGPQTRKARGADIRRASAVGE